MRSFTTVKKTDDISMEQHLQHVQRLKRILEEQRVIISDNIYNSILLNSVSDEEWKVVVNIFEFTDKLTPTMIINCLLEEKRKLVSDNSYSDQNLKMALLTNQKQSGATGRSNKPKGAQKLLLKCTFCEKTGHIEADC